MRERADRRARVRLDPHVIKAFEAYAAERSPADVSSVLRLARVRSLAELPDSQGPYFLSLLGLSPLELAELAADRKREERRQRVARRRARAGRASSG